MFCYSPYSLPTHRVQQPGQWPYVSKFDIAVTPVALLLRCVGRGSNEMCRGQGGAKPRLERPSERRSVGGEVINVALGGVCDG